MEPPVQTFLQTENISWCPIETTCASSDGTELCTAEFVQDSMWPELTSAVTTGLPSTKSEGTEEFSTMTEA